MKTGRRLAGLLALATAIACAGHPVPPDAERPAAPDTERAAAPDTQRAAAPDAERVAAPDAERVAAPDAERAAPAAADVAVEPGERFRLSPGETAAIAGGEWRVRFVGMRGDSRCPVDVECVWAGSAEVAVETAGPEGPWVERSLHTGIEPRELRADGFTLSLLDVEPAPRSTAPIDPARYVAILQVDR